MLEKISILKESGETLVSNIVSVFMIPDTEKRYIITTENSVDPHGLTVLHVSELVDDVLQKVLTDEEWSSIKTIMRAIISGNVGSYKYLPPVLNASANGQYSRDISVSASAAKQMVDNYNAGDKNPVISESANSAGAGAVLDVSADVNMSNANNASQVTPTSIFPTNNGVLPNDEEVVPGIAEFNGNPVMSGNIPLGVNEQSTIGNFNMNNGVTPVAQDLAMQMGTIPVNNVGVEQSLQPLNPMASGVNTNVGPVVVSNDISSNPPFMNNGNAISTDSGMMNQPVVNGQLIPNQMGIGAQPIMQSAGVIDANEVQVATPTMAVPNGQIVQGVQNPGLMNNVAIDMSVTPNFGPNASLDEVVVGAQEMFMEGVRNLIQTIQEKVYRDLYNKESELKNREIIVEQKEQLVNSQMMAMMNNFTNSFNSLQGQSSSNTSMMQQPVSMQGQAQPSLVPNANMNVPPIIQPTVVQASNDVK